MRSNYKGRIIIFILSLFLSVLVKAQTEMRDSVVDNHNKQINIAYGKQPAWMVTGAVSSVSGDDLQKTFSSNLGNTLFGKLPGLTVIQGGGEPGLQTPSLKIRGTSTYNSGNAVLVIVDGVESTYDQLVSDEIESITLLKDAVSTAMYGSRAANGVLLVTTKRGKEGPLKINFSVQVGSTSPTRLPKFVGSYDYANLFNEALVNDGLPTKYSQDDLDAYQNHTDPYFHPDVNWYNQLLRKAVPSTNYDLNFSGGSKSVRYFVLLNYLSNQGLYKKTGDLSPVFSKNSTYSRLNFRTNVDIDLSDNLTATLLLGGTVEDKANPAGNNTSAIFDKMASMPPNSFPLYATDNSFGGNLTFSNPWGDLLQTGSYTSNGRVFQSMLKLAEKLDFITPGLSISGLVSFNNNFTSLSNMSRQYLRMSIAKDILGNTIYTTIGQNTALASSESESNQWRNFALQGFLNYNRSFGKTAVDAVMLLNSSEYTVTGGIGIPYKNLGLSGRYTLTNNEKYIGEFSFGYTASDGFPKGDRWGFFPSGSLGWVVSKEDFLKDNNIFNFLKIRGSYGLTGNQSNGASRRYMWITDYVGMSSYYFGTTQTSTSTIGEGMAADSSITWEKQRQMNFGFEATVFKNFDVSFDVFQQNRYDILSAPYLTVPQFIGESNVSGLGTPFPQYNVGKVSNKGFEAMIRFNSNKSKDFQYFIQADGWYAKNKIEYNAEALQLFPYLYQTGKPIGQPYVLEAIGFFKDAQDIASSAKQLYTSSVQPGDIKYKDQNNDGVINQNDYFPIGKPSLPTLTASLRTGLKYKGFDLDLLFQGVTGNTIMESGNYFYAFQNNGTAPVAALNRWTPATAGTAVYPRLSSVNNLNNFRQSSFWQVDGSFIKLRYVELGYSLPERIVKKVMLNSARVFVNGTNLFSLDHLHVTDPETISGYPATKTFSVGVRVQM
jgi:TonB-linked SusC/RagA family outer membrane protein